MPYIPNLNPSGRWFAARTFLVQPAALVKSCVGTETKLHPNQLRLAFVNILRALRTLHRLPADTNASHQVEALQPYLKNTEYASVQSLQNTFWEDPNRPHLEKLLKMTYNVFFDVYAIDKDYDLFCDMSDYELYKIEHGFKDAYPLFVNAGLAASVEDAIARYGSDAGAAVDVVRSNPAYQSALRALRLQEWREYHSACFWEWDELDNLNRVYPTSYKGLNCIP